MGFRISSSTSLIIPQAKAERSQLAARGIARLGRNKASTRRRMIFPKHSSDMEFKYGKTDIVFLKGIKFDAAVGLDAWHRAGKVQPVSIDIELVPNDGLDAAAREDDVSLTLDYGKLNKAFAVMLTGQSYETIHQLYQAVRAGLPTVLSWSIAISLPKAILLADEGVSMTWQSNVNDDGVPLILQNMSLNRINCKCIVGVNPHERLEKQSLLISIAVHGIEARLSPSTLAGVNFDATSIPIYQDVVKTVVERVEASDYQTVEALATAIAQIVTMNFGFEYARVTIEKPSAIATVNAAGVTIGRSKTFFENKDFWKIKRP